ncbi:MAG TPA: aminotransferase class V-fold PLP-dependent enzyme [Candidatus Acidoferrales bacterium]|nr:aminotransferase class V-fold PLP-dependent enzyme [Candidatus Acidoferrales bacterium]
MLERRDFLQRAAAAAALIGLPLPQLEKQFCEEPPPIPSAELYQSNEDAYWARMRPQWLLAKDRINLNCGSVGCTPLPVLRAMIDHVLQAEEFAESYYPWFGYEENPPLHEVVDSLAAFLNVDRDDIALVRNATEANNTVGNGFDMKPGDEVVMTDQEHPGGRCVWDQRVVRHGIAIRQVTLPQPPASAGQIVDLFEQAITPRTRIVLFSHITTVTGVVLPAKQICAMARRKGVLTHVDGAHVTGQIPLDIRDIGCDFYGSSPHKWLMAPKGTGFLYVRDELQKQLYVNIVSGSWRDYSLKAYRFSNLGTSNLSIMIGLKAALDFYRAIGPDRIFGRIHQLARRVHDYVAQKSQLKLINASADPFYGGMVTFAAAESTVKNIFDECAKRQIRIAGGAGHVRISTHVFTQPAELDALFEATDAALARST